MCRGSLFDAIDKGVLQHPDGRPNMRAVLAAAQEVAGGWVTGEHLVL